MNFWHRLFMRSCYESVLSATSLLTSEVVVVSTIAVNIVFTLFLIWTTGYARFSMLRCICITLALRGSGAHVVWWKKWSFVDKFSIVKFLVQQVSDITLLWESEMKGRKYTVVQLNIFILYLYIFIMTMIYKDVDNIRMLHLQSS